MREKQTFFRNKAQRPFLRKKENICKTLLGKEFLNPVFRTAANSDTLQMKQTFTNT
jgi:hypothetical protein